MDTRPVDLAAASEPAHATTSSESTCGLASTSNEPFTSGTAFVAKDNEDVILLTEEHEADLASGVDAPAAGPLAPMQTTQETEHIAHIDSIEHIEHMELTKRTTSEGASQ